VFAFQPQLVAFIGEDGARNARAFELSVLVVDDRSGAGDALQRALREIPAAAKIDALIRDARADGDSVGGVICCVIENLPAGLGSPVFDRFEADLAKAMLSLPATKGFEIGSGFAGTVLRGSAHNDEFVRQGGRIRTATNRSGGTQGGITNGEDVVFRIAFKPTATVLRPQKTVRPDGRATELSAKGRHDPCVLPRAVPIVEAMAALVAVDHWIRDRGQNAPFGRCGRKA
jgi:chorismate synthase